MPVALLETLMLHLHAQLTDEELAQAILAGAQSPKPVDLPACREVLRPYAHLGPDPQRLLNHLLACANELLSRQALQRLKDRNCLETVDAVAQTLVRHFRMHESEAFVVMFLDAQHRLILLEEMFRGSLTQTSVYPRQLVKRALEVNAAAVILAHNHPSGVPEPSRADEFLTRSIQSALALVDVRVLDHFVVGGEQTISFAARGLI